MMRVLIVDSIAETRDNLVKLLHFEQRITVVGSVGTGAAAVAEAAATHPDVVLLDLNLSEPDGLQVIAAIQQHNPATRFVLLSVGGRAHFFPKQLPPNLAALLIKPISGTTLIDALRHIRDL
jgi:DNA-binding NarL/FixJ family response regulator